MDADLPAQLSGAAAGNCTLGYGYIGKVCLSPVRADCIWHGPQALPRGMGNGSSCYSMTSTVPH